MNRRTFLRSSSTAALAAALLGGVRPARAGSLEPWTGPIGSFSLKDLSGKVHDLAAYRGQVVLVNFWATWCEPCRQEMPSIQRLRNKLARRAFTAFAVNVDEPDARVQLFVKQTGLDLPVLLDPNKTVTRSWNVRVLPVTYVLGKDGRARYRAIGDLDWSADQIVGTISQLIAAN